MRIGITGSTGLIGRAFTALAEASGHEVIAYSRKQEKLPHTVETHTLPSLAPWKLPETRLDALVHLAGESLMGLWTENKKKRIWTSRVDHTQALMEHLKGWSANNRPGIVLGASGIGFYGSRGDSNLDEETPSGQGLLARLCVEWEAATRQAWAWDARVVHLRTSMVLASEGGAWPSLRRLFRLGLGGNLHTGRQWMSWIHVQDEAAMILWALEREDVTGPLNLCTPFPELNSNFTQKLSSHLHRPAFMNAPALALRLVLRGMADEMLLCSQRGVPAKAVALGYQFAHPRLEDALESLV